MSEHHRIKKKGVGIFSGLQLRDCGLPKLCREEGEWGFLFLTSDSAGANILAAKYLISELSVFENLIILVCPRYIHIVSNSVKHSLTHLFPVGDLTRVAHVLNAKGFGQIDAVFAVKFDEAIICDDGLEAGACYDLWAEFLKYVVSQRGPFQMRARSRNFYDLAKRAARYFPRGPPRPN